MTEQLQSAEPVDGHVVQDRLTAALLLAADAREAVAARDNQAAMDDLGVLQLVIADLSSAVQGQPTAVPAARILLHLCEKSPVRLVGECPARKVLVPEVLITTLLQLLVERLGTRTPGRECTLRVRENGQTISFVGRTSVRLGQAAQDRLIRGADGVLSRHGGRVVLVGLGDRNQLEVVVQVPAR